MKKIAILGSTGSIGRQSLAVVEAMPERFAVVGLAAGANVEELVGQIERHRPDVVSVGTAALAFWKWMGMPLPYLLGMAVVGNIAGQMGDLLESACKRSAGVKDSGGMLPGHGGILDRIDALILCIPVVWYYLMVVNPPIL